MVVSYGALNRPSYLSRGRVDQRDGVSRCRLSSGEDALGRSRRGRPEGFQVLDRADVLGS